MQLTYTHHYGKHLRRVLRSKLVGYFRLLIEIKITLSWDNILAAHILKLTKANLAAAADSISVYAPRLGADLLFSILKGTVLKSHSCNASFLKKIMYTLTVIYQL